MLLGPDPFSRQLCEINMKSGKMEQGMMRSREINNYSRDRVQGHSRKIYTRKGDEGKTSLIKGRRVPKYYLRIEINGLIDELNSWIGYVRSINRDPVAEEMLGRLQPRLNILCSDIVKTL